MVGFRRRPLLRGAALAGGATLAYQAGKRGEQQQQEQQQEAYSAGAASAQQQAPAAGGGMSQDAMAQLAQLGKLHDQGVLTDEEFAEQKAKILGQ